jgi:hypothetical protein
MKRIIFTTESTNFNKIEPLQSELKRVGVSHFDIDFENKKISLICPHSLNINIVECAVRRAGFKCTCFTVFAD